jgi:hypothetical protein
MTDFKPSILWLPGVAISSHKFQALKMFLANQPFMATRQIHSSHKKPLKKPCYYWVYKFMATKVRGIRAREAKMNTSEGDHL